MRDGDGAGLLRVVDEVALGVVVGVLADDLDGVLVGAHGAVGAEAEEQRADGLRLRWRSSGRRQRGVGDIVDDADGEVILRLGLASSSKTALTMAGVNSLEESP